VRCALVAVGVVCLAWPACAQPSLPDDVARFIEHRDACDHFRGEDPYDAARRKFLEEQTRRFCVGSDARLARLKEKYRGNSAVMQKLDGYESRIEPAPAGDSIRRE
jgi:hypothetical protein